MLIQQPIEGWSLAEQNKKEPFLLILSHNTIHDPLLEIKI